MRSTERQKQEKAAFTNLLLIFLKISIFAKSFSLLLLGIRSWKLAAEKEGPLHNNLGHGFWS